MFLNINIGIRAHIKFCEETSCTTTVKDSTGHGWDVTLYNGAVAAYGVLTLDGNTQYAAFPSGLVSDLTEYTIMCKVNVADVYLNAIIWDFGMDSGTDIYLQASFEATDMAMFGGDLNDMNRQWFQIESIATNKWIHISICYKDGRVGAYIDGVQIASFNFPIIPTQFSSNPLNWIGRSIRDIFPYFFGSIADFRVYERALSAHEIQGISQGSFLQFLLLIRMLLA